MGTNWLMLEQSPDEGHALFGARVASVGRRLPETHRTTDEVMASTSHRTRVDLERLTGIHERRVSVGDEDTFSLAMGAARDCLSRWDGKPEDIDLVVSCSITKYRDGLTQWMEPPLSVALADEVGAHHARTFDLSNACAGMLSGVFVANNQIRTGRASTVLVVSGEYISQLSANAAKHVHTIASRELASLTLGDAGAAMIVERAPEGVDGISTVGFTTIAEHSRLCLAYPAKHDPGARMYTKSRALQAAAIEDVPIVLQEILDTTGLSIEDIACVIPHQTSARAIRKGMATVSAALGGAPQQPAVVTVDHYGNTASTTHTVALIEELEAGHLQEGDRVALIALASGIELGVVLFTVDAGLLRARPVTAAGQPDERAAEQEDEQQDEPVGAPHGGSDGAEQEGARHGAQR
jgi:3-oxoacyl-[acyl-carrier-protein] synthase-3